MIARTLNSLGYYPSEPTVSNRENLERNSIKDYLLRLGVAGVAAGNCMMIATSLYQAEFSGMEERFKYFLQIMSMLIATPALFYSALPFYPATISGIRVATLHIDFPISLGLILGYLISSVNAIFNFGPTYFDSLTVLIFFMLVARLFQRLSVARAVRVAEQAKCMIDFAYVQREGKVQRIYPYSLKVGDMVVVYPGARIPVDGKIVKGRTTIDSSIITGEAEPQIAIENSLVLAGTRNLENEIIVEVAAMYVNSRFYKLADVQNAVSEIKSSSNKISDVVSSYFVPVVLIVTIFNFLYWNFNSGIAKAAETTLLQPVITCPCAIGLAAPLTIVNAMSKAFRKGIFVKIWSFRELFSNFRFCF